MSRRNSNYENNPPARQELVKDFENVSNSDMVEYAQAQIGRLEIAAQERFGDKDAWMQKDASFEGGKEFSAVVDALTMHNQEPTSDEKLALRYMDSVVYKNEARAVVNEDKVSKRQGLHGRHTEAALQGQLVKEAADAMVRKDGYEADIARLMVEKQTPENEKSIGKLHSVSRADKGIINDALVATDEIRNPSGQDTAERFFSEVAIRAGGEAQLTDEELADLRVTLYKNMRRNIQSARALSRLTTVAPFRKEDSQIDPKQVSRDIYELAGKNRESVKYAYAYDDDNSVRRNEAKAGEIDGEFDGQELAQQLEDLAAQVRDQNQDLESNDGQQDVGDEEKPSSIPKPSDVPQRQPFGPNPAQNQAAGQAHGTGTGPTGSQQPGTGAPAGSQGGTGNAGEQTGGAPGGNGENGENAGNQSGDAAPEQQNSRESADVLAFRRAQQQIRVENAAAALQASSLSRSKQFLSVAEVDAYAETLHTAFGREVYELMQFDRPPILDDPTVTQAEKNAFISKYAFDEYHKVTQATVESMGGEKDPKKRKRNARLLRLGGLGLGFVLGGPAGAVIGGAIGLGISKGLDSNMKKREELKNAVTRYEAQDAADGYLTDTPDRNGEPYSEKSAFEAATMNLMRNFENGLVKRRRLNIGKSALTGVAWTAGTMIVAHEAAAALQYAGDQAFQFVSKASWSGTGVPWDGGLNPNFNYTMHEKPISMKVLGGLFKASTPELGMTVGGAILAGLGGIKAHEKIKKRNSQNDNGRVPANAA